MGRITATIILLMLLARPGLSAPSGTPAGEIRRGGHVYKEQLGDLPNFHTVHPYLYRGGAPTKAGLVKLKELGVKTIIDLRAHPAQVGTEAEAVRELGLYSINLPMSSKAPTKEQMDTFFKTVSKAKAGNGPVFVHCAHGSDRTGCLIGLWRVRQDGWTYDKAYEEMRKYYFSPKFTELSKTVKRFAGRSEHK